MSMHRRQRFDTDQPSVAVRDYPSMLRAVFRSAVGCALATTLAGSGCSATATPRDDAPPMSGAGGQVAPNGHSGGTSSGGTGGVAGGGLVGAAGRDAGGSEAPPTPQAGAGSGGTGQAGSTGAAGATATPPEGSVEPHCDGATLLALEGITPDETFDGAEFRTFFPGATPSATAVSGELCAMASDHAACLAAIADAEVILPHSDSCGMIGNCDRYIVTTSGDEVRMYNDRTDLLRLLGPLDSPEDVVLLLTYDRYNVECADPARPPENGGPTASAIRVVDDGFEADVVLNVSTCPFQYAHVTLHVAPDGTVTELTRELLPEQSVCAGRRPEGLLSRHLPSTGSALGEHFARMAHLEAASVTAFEVLAFELAHHGAPPALIDSALRAVEDELRHTTLTAALARRFGAAPTTPWIAPRPLRSLEAIALDNAEEGCVRECFGAVIGCYQAETASDAEIARVMTVIAEDETRHAALAFEIAAWVDGQLDAAARARVHATRSRAASQLRRELRCTFDEDTRRALGLPDSRAAERLHQTLERALWAA